MRTPGAGEICWPAQKQYEATCSLSILGIPVTTTAEPPLPSMISCLPPCFRLVPCYKRSTENQNGQGDIFDSISERKTENIQCKKNNQQTLGQNYRYWILQVSAMRQFIVIFVKMAFVLRFGYSFFPAEKEEGENHQKKQGGVGARHHARKSVASSVVRPKKGIFLVG